MNRNLKILVTGSTGYIGGRLVQSLLDSGYSVRVFVRDASRLQGRSWMDDVEIFQGDVFDENSLTTAMDGIEAAFYLIHSMSGSDDFHHRDVLAAQNFGKAAKSAGVGQIIYLGGLGDPNTNLSEHLKSRQETGRILAHCGVPVTEFRAAIIVGSGSVSFEMIRYLTERIPIIVCPRWVYTCVQPIAIDDVLAYLTAALVVPESSGKVIEIGGSEVMTYGDMMMRYAEARGLKRVLIPVPILSPQLSSHWVQLMTPVPISIIRPLILGLRNEVVVRDNTAKKLFPDITPLDYSTAVKRALANLEVGKIETHWTDALVSSQGDRTPTVMKTQEGMIIVHRKVVVQASPREVYDEFTTLGGKRGWLFFNWAWQILGTIDRLLGGVGLRRGRRDPVDVRVGDAIDFWRVEQIKPGEMMRLRAEMKVPGKVWLQFEAKSINGAQTLLHQSSFFAPKGLFGILFWYGLYPMNSFVFSGLLRKLKESAEHHGRSPD